MAAIPEFLHRASAEAIPSDLRSSTKLIALAAILGTLAGLTATGVRLLIGFFTNLHFYQTLSFDPSVPSRANLGLWVILVPAVGAVLATSIVWFVTRDKKIRGVGDIVETVTYHQSRVSPRGMAANALATTVSVGAGGASGREGPIVQIGAAVGVLTSRFLHLSTAQRRVLIAAGAAGGIAATFNTPIAGVIFAVEILLFEFRASSFVPLCVSSVFGSLVTRQLIGDEPAFTVPAYALVNPYYEVPIYLLMGILAGIASVITLRTLVFTDERFDALKVHWIVKPFLGGLLVGVIGFFFPQVLGVGYEVVVSALDGELGFKLLIALFVLKLLAFALTRGSGGAAGAFSPSLFLGAMLGTAFGLAASYLWPGQAAPVGAYALVGMGAMYAGITGGVLTSIVMLFEMTRTFEIILPLIFCIVVADVIARAFHQETVYGLKLAKMGLPMERGMSVNILDRVFVKDIMTKRVDTADPDMRVRDVVTLTFNTGHHGFPVLDRAGKLIGIITQSDLRKKVPVEEMDRSVRDVMTTTLVTVHPSDTAHMALTKLVEHNIGHIPVVDPEDSSKLLGFLTKTDILNVEKRAIEETLEGDKPRTLHPAHIHKEAPPRKRA